MVNEWDGIIWYNLHNIRIYNPKWILIQPESCEWIRQTSNKRTCHGPTWGFKPKQQGIEVATITTCQDSRGSNYRTKTWWFPNGKNWTTGEPVPKMIYIHAQIFPDAPCIVYLPTFGSFWLIYGVNVGKYSIHGAYGMDGFPHLSKRLPCRLCLNFSSGMEIPIDQEIHWYLRHVFFGLTIGYSNMYGLSSFPISSIKLDIWRLTQFSDTTILWCVTTISNILPSGKLSWLWKITIFVFGKSTIHGPFSIAMLNY